MGKKFYSVPEDLQGENYGWVYGGYLMLDKLESDEEKYQFVKRVLDINPNVKWAWDRIVDLARRTGRYEANTNKADVYDILSRARLNIKNHGADNRVEVIDLDKQTISITYPKWFKDDFGSGCVVVGDNGKMHLKCRCFGKGKLNVTLMGVDIRGTSGERLPFWVTFRELKINGEQLLKKSESVWHDANHTCNVNVEDQEIVEIEASWVLYPYKPHDLKILASSMR